MNTVAFAYIAMIALAVCIGSARIVAWILDRRAHTANTPIREEALIAQARAEVGK